VGCAVPHHRSKTYLFGAREPEQTLRDLSESVMREVIGDRTVDEVLTIGRHDIETSTLKRLADLLFAVRTRNFKSNKLQLATVRPPPAVQAASTMSTKRSREKQTAINQAWAVYNDAVPNARGRRKSARNKPRRMRFAA